MRKRVFLFASLSLALVMAAGAALGASTRVLLSPKPLRGPSDAIPLREGEPRYPNTLGENYWLTYDSGDEPAYLGGLSSTDTIMVWFQSPAACTLLEIHVDLYTAGDFDLFAADVYDTIDFANDYEEYHGGSVPGPAPISAGFNDSTGLTNPGFGWQVLDVTSRPDVGKNIFVGGYVLRSSGAPNPIIDIHIPKPAEGYHTLMSRAPGGDPSMYGWYSSWHHVYVRALVSLYENPPPFIDSYTKHPDTYSLNGRSVQAYAWDIGVPADSTGVATLRLLYDINGGPEDTIPMTLISGTIKAGTWAAYLPPASANDTVSYYVNGVDLQGLESATATSSYVIRAGKPTAELLFVNDDYYGFNGYDPVAAVVPDSVYDFWEADAYGLPDASVINFGYKAILWNTWDGTGSYGFVADTLLVAQFLDNGGALWISSQDLIAGGFGYSWGSYTTQPGEWVHDHLHLMGGVDDYAGDTISVFYGVPGDPITDAFADWPVTCYPYGWAGPGYNYAGSCVIDLNDLNVSAIFYDVGDPISGYKYDLPGGYKIVFLYWPFNDLINLDGSVDTTSQDILVGNVMTWFGVDPVGIAERLRGRLESRSRSYLLWQNWPNPTNGPTTISFNVPEPTRATLQIYDVTGRKVSTLVDGELSAGRHSVKWNGRDRFGQEVPSGVYIYRLTAGAHNMARKMVFMK
ncbi:MAG: FlgD immunoglobulin-like domain containing protein [bacterium]